MTLIAQVAYWVEKIDDRYYVIRQRIWQREADVRAGAASGYDSAPEAWEVCKQLSGGKQFIKLPAWAKPKDNDADRMCWAIVGEI